MKKKYLVSTNVLLIIALCIVSGSFFKNHKRLKNKILYMNKEEFFSGESKLSYKDITFLMKVLGEDFNKVFAHSAVNKVKLAGEEFYFCDMPTSQAVNLIAREIGRSTYDFSDIKFKPGDVVIDIGGNVGMISIFLAKKFPFLKIYAFEPVRKNYENFKHNLRLNNIPEGTVTVENLGVTKDGRDIVMCVNMDVSGSSGLSELAHKNEKVSIANEFGKSCTLADIFNKNGIQECKLLKIDCEGAEYEILYATDGDILKKCEYLRGEFHENKNIKKYGYSAEQLKHFCQKFIKNVLVCVYSE